MRRTLRATARQRSWRQRSRVAGAGIAALWDESMDGDGVEPYFGTSNRSYPEQSSIAATASMARHSGHDAGVGANDYPTAVQGGGTA